MAHPPDRLHWTGMFADPATEAGYQHAHLAEARALARLLVLSILALDAAYAPIDLINYQFGRDGWLSCGFRLAVVGWSVGVWRWLGRAVSVAAVEARLLVWCGPAAALNMLTLVVLPGDHAGAAAAFAVGVVLCYLLPARLGWCGLIGAAVSAGYLAILAATLRPGHPTHLLLDTGVGFVMANGLGAAVGRRLQADRRRRWAAAEALAAAREEVRTLRGLLPICACCKKIRDDAGQWQRLEAYIQTRTDARFSHGVCPDCLASEYGLTPDGVKLPTVGG